MSEGKPGHVPVLVDQFLAQGFPESGKVFVDATFGLGGHSFALLQKFPAIDRIIGIDRDGEILAFSEAGFLAPKISLYRGRFSSLQEILDKAGISRIDGILLDLGISSHQIDQAERGFSFMRPGPLDMRMDQSQGKTAADIVNHSSGTDLADLFYRFGEERFSRQIAAAILRYREQKSITRTEELVSIVISAIPLRIQRTQGIHPATRVFQALRIMVNHELEELELVLAAANSLLNPGGRISVISFHSLEDRIVKQYFQTQAKGCICPPSFPACNCGRKPTLKILTRKPAQAGLDEISRNPRSRSAKMRIAEKLP